MAGTLIRQTMFTSGEVDEIAYTRTDAQELYLSAAQQLKNMEVGTTGLARKRKGSLTVANASDYAAPNSRMYEFIDKFGNHFILMSADKKFIVYTEANTPVNVITINGNQVVTIRNNNVIAQNQNLIYVQTITTPYEMADLDEIDYTEDEDSLILSHGNYPPARIYISSYTPLTFSYEVLDIYPLPAFDFNNVNYSAMNVTFSNPTPATFQIVLTGAGANGFTTDWIGGVIIALGRSDISPLGYGIITVVNVLSPTQVAFAGNVQVPFATPADMPTFGSQYSIRQPAWGNPATGFRLGYPRSTLYYQNRLFFASNQALPDTIFASKINAPINFDVGTGRDTDAIVYTIGETNTGRINWLNGGKQLEIFTENDEYVCPQDSNSALTPTTFVCRKQSSYGSSPSFKPINYINNTYFMAKTGKAFINFAFTGVGLAYKSTNISVASEHIIKNPVNRALLRGSDTSQDNFVYILNNDDTITAFQFAFEYKLAAFTPHVYQEDVQVISLVSVNNRIYMLKYFNKTGQYLIEMLSNDVKVDSYQNLSMASTGIINGLEYLEGYTVQVLYQNQDFGEYVVVNGEITVDNQTGISDTVAVGLLYDVNVTPMYIFAGAANAPLKKKITRIYVDYYKSLDFQINGKQIPYMTFPEIQQGTGLQLRNGTEVVYAVQGWQRNQTINITQRSPFDLHILSITYDVKASIL